MKKLPITCVIVVLGLAFIFYLHAQETAMPVPMGTATLEATPVESAAPDSIVQLTAESHGLRLITPADVPDSGTFWVVDTNGDSVPWPCPPPDANLPTYDLTGAGAQFLVDRTGGKVATDGQSVQDALAGLATAVVDLISQIQTAVAPQPMVARMGINLMAMAGGGSSGPVYPFPTNGLWLQITNISNGLAYLNLMNATDYVYEIYAKTDLTATNWDIAGEVFPTDTNCMPFNLSLATYPSSLFLWARDWTGITSNGNTTPDWWFWEYFGTTALSDTNLDIYGHTLLQDYQSGADPNVISFTVRLGNQNFSSSPATGTYLVIGGLPSYEAVLVNDTNLNDAAWQRYDGNISMNLGPTNGTYQVWLGLKGNAPQSLPTWIGTQVTLNQNAPQIFIASPTNNTTASPLVQVQGYSLTELANVTYDLSNAVGVVTNQPGLLTGHYLDTNTLVYSTNYFQCYDVPLTNGLNVITVHTTDLAGNTTTTNLNVTLDYTTATNPSVVLTWPQNGMELCGSSFTVRGWTEDAASEVTATITDANGDTNTVTGEVERTGVLWAENLPLNSGTNWVTLSVTNAAGLSNATNFYVVQSSMTLTLTSVDGDLWQPTVNVSGQISDPAASVWVNGVQGTNNGDGTWSAANVPVSSGGVASFDMSTLPPGGSDPDASTNLDKPAEIVMESAKGSYQSMEDAGTLHWNGNWDWSDTSGGTEHSEFIAPDGNWYVNDYTIAPNLNITLDHYTTSDGTDTNIVNDGTTSFEQAIGELAGSSYLPGTGVLWSSGDYNTHVKMTLHTGGKGKSKRQNLFQLTATATESLTTPPYSQSIAPQQISVAGQTLGNDGIAWKMFPDGSSQDVTPQVGAPYYDFTVAATKYHPYIGLTTSTMNANLDTDVPEVCVGQTVTLGMDWLGGIPPVTSIDNVWWHLPDKYVNQQTNYSSTCSTYVKNTDLLTNTAIQCWYVNLPGGACSVREALHFSNGQSVNITAAGSFTVYRPSVNQPVTYGPYGAAISSGLLSLEDNTMTFDVTINSKYSGNFGLTQLVKMYSDTVVIPPDLLVGSTTFGSFDLDGGQYYDGPNDRASKCQISDAPGQPLIFLIGYYTGNWQDYVRFTPNGGIPVTLGRIDWDWSATCANPDPLIGWYITSDGVDGPTLHGDDSFPLWKYSGLFPLIN